MTVSLDKTHTVAASRSLGRDILLATFLPVHVTNVQSAGRGKVTLSFSTVNGAMIVRTVPAGKGYRPAPLVSFA